MFGGRFHCEGEKKNCGMYEVRQSRYRAYIHLKFSGRGRIVDLAVNCYGCHVLQKALDCEEDIRLVIVSELLLGDPAQTLVNKHASHVWSKVSWEIHLSNDLILTWPAL